MTVLRMDNVGVVEDLEAPLRSSSGLVSYVRGSQGNIEGLAEQLS